MNNKIIEFENINNLECLPLEGINNDLTYIVERINPLDKIGLFKGDKYPNMFSILEKNYKMPVSTKWLWNPFINYFDNNGIKSYDGGILIQYKKSMSFNSWEKSHNIFIIRPTYVDEKIYIQI